VYQFDWASQDLWRQEQALPDGFSSRLAREDVDGTLLVHWQEHCIECAVPACYEFCPIYVERRDRKCARFVYGIYPNSGVAGLLDRGADVRFRRWGKLETRLYGRSLSVAEHRRLDRADDRVTSATNVLAGALERVNPKRRLNGALTVGRDRMLAARADAPGDLDDFVLECFSADREPFRLILEYEREGEIRLRHAFEIAPGHNFHTLSAASFGPLDRDPAARLMLYPDEDAERRVVFTWLDFVRYARGAGPADKVKAVAWDLDNTLWEGTLIEDGPAACEPRPAALELIEALDQRGIVQTVVSKNDHAEAWQLVERLGLQDHFLYPAINWGRKSEGLRQIAERLNIGLDTFAVIDDSAFERAEITEALPMVRAYDAERIGELLGLAEFDVPITEMSRRRRQSYLTQVQRERALESHGGDYESFLRGCEMRMRLFEPRTEEERRRCLELVQRTNQLNLSARRHTADDFEALLGTEGVLCVAFDCRDRFGHYGVVGFASVDERGEAARVTDFVMSCRVTQKRVERTFFEWLASRERERGAESLEAELVRTPRNGPLRKVLEELPFAAAENADERVLLRMGLGEIGPPHDVVALDVELPSP
jgi:FkbH-like protein